MTKYIDRTQEPDEAFTATLARFDAAPTPPEVLREQVARAMQAVDDCVGSPVLPWDDKDTDRAAYYRLADAALAVFRDQQDPAMQRVLGTPPCKEGDPDPTPHGADNGLGCGMRDSSWWGWICTREARHPADWHIAGDGDEVRAIWPVVGQS